MSRPVPDTIIRNGVFHFKRRVPSHLIGKPPFGNAEFVQFSLKTRDRRVALTRAENARQSFDQKMAGQGDREPEVRASNDYATYVARIRPTRSMMLSVAEAFRWEIVENTPVHHDAQANAEFGHLSSDDIVGGRPLSYWLEEQQELERSPLTSGNIEAANRLADRHGWDLPAGSNDHTMFCDYLRRARLGAIKAIVEANTPEGFDLLLSAVPKRGLMNAYTVGQSVSEYLVKKSEKAEMVKKLPAALRAWNELVGIQPVSLIRKPDVHNFRDRLLKVPERAGDRFRGMTLAQAIEANIKRDEPYPTLSPRTVKIGYIGMLNAAMSEAAKNDYVLSNPFAGVHVEGSDDLSEERRPFRDYELKAIFSHPIWTGCKSGDQRNTPGALIIKDHYYWPPLLAFFTGMRGSEIGGLRLADVALPDEHPLPHFHVRGTKTSSAVRDIPLHPLLMKLGFAEYVEELRSAGQARLFPAWKLPAGKKKYSMSPCQNNFNKKVLHADRLKPEGSSGKGPEGLTFHCFRHTLENEMSKGVLDDAYRLRVMGHSQKGTKRNYRKPDLAEYHASFCEKLTFTRVDLRHLFIGKKRRR